MTPAANVLVVGLGNVLLGDEGIGVHVARALKARSYTGEVDVLDGGTVGYELLPWLEGRARVILVDAIHTRGAPGTIYRIPAEEIAGDLPAATSAHGSDIGLLIRAGLALEPAPEILIVGVVPESFERFRLELSPCLRSRFDSIVEAVLEAAQFRSAPAGGKRETAAAAQPGRVSWCGPQARDELPSA
jgi:hydrogenase maturation protease